MQLLLRKLGPRAMPILLELIPQKVIIQIILQLILRAEVVVKRE
jgi:hypothetical protein